LVGFKVTAEGTEVQRMWVVATWDVAERHILWSGLGLRAMQLASKCAIDVVKLSYKVSVVVDAPWFLVCSPSVSH